MAHTVGLLISEFALISTNLQKLWDAYSVLAVTNSNTQEAKVHDSRVPNVTLGTAI